MPWPAPPRVVLPLHPQPADDLRRRIEGLEREVARLKQNEHTHPVPMVPLPNYYPDWTYRPQHVTALPWTWTTTHTISSPVVTK